MKKIYSIMMLAMLAVCSVALVSCGDDDDAEDGIVGTWVSDEDGMDQYFVFNSNGSFRWFDYDDEDYGKYTLKSGILTLIYDESDYDEFKCEINGKKMRLYELDDPDPRSGREPKWELMDTYTKK